MQICLGSSWVLVRCPRIQFLLVCETQQEYLVLSQVPAVYVVTVGVSLLWS